MKSKQKLLLALDGVINLILGIFLLLFPAGIAKWLGLPYTGTGFYPGILGAVLVGIGIALLIERYGAANGPRGLGLEGAIAINFCGAGALLLWLIFYPFDMPLRGHVILWAIALVVFFVGCIELLARSQNQLDF